MVRIAVISDIHGNLPALEAVVVDAGQVDAWWCLGDVVGYGADPNGCLDRVRGLATIALPGNHDLGAVGLAALEHFNDDAAACLVWTADRLEPDHAAYLRALAEQPVRTVGDRYTLVHGSPRDPTWEYVLTPGQARASFRAFATQFCLVGHTHQPAAYDEHGRTNFERAAMAAYQPALALRFLCNPGAVGQPRDGDWRASYLLIDDDEGLWQWRRVIYDHDEAAARIRRAGLPEIEALRLRLGR